MTHSATDDRASWGAELDTDVSEANVPTLLAVLCHLEGTERWLVDRYRPTRNRGIGDNSDGGLAPEIQQEVRAAAALAITRASQPGPALPRLEPEELLRILGFTVGEDVPPEYADYLAAEMASVLAPRAGHAEGRAAGSLAGVTATVVGAGISGLAAAIRLGRLGADVRILEQADEVGGTWHRNRYPGCGVDTPSHLYSYSFTAHDWPDYYATQAELLRYLRRVADGFGLRPLVEHGVRVTGATYDAGRCEWTIHAEDADGPRADVRSQVLISAVGAFGRPSVPGIAGLDLFGGDLVHTADWPDELDLRGRSVAVIGTGASAMQLVPAVADEVGELTVIQRSPQWAAPFEQFHQPVPPGVRRLIGAFPLYRAWYRARLGWVLNDKIHASLQVDPAWADPRRSVNAVNDAHRVFLTRYLESELEADRHLLDKVLPGYPPFGKRMLLDNGWFRTLRRPHVHLRAEAVERVDAHGVVFADGSRVDPDVLVLATGFDVVSYLSPLRIRGVGGRLLSEVWDGDDARAYLGMVVPGFPNLVCLYGPNAAPGHGGSYVATAECQLDYVCDLLERTVAAGASAFECRPEVHDEYTARVDEANERMIWAHPGMSTYYRNSRGRVVYTNPWRIVDYWAMTRTADLGEYLLTRAVDESGPA